MNKSKLWKNEGSLNEICALFKDGTPIYTISKKFKSTYFTIVKILQHKRVKLSTRKVTNFKDTQHTEIIELYSKLKSIKRVAKYYKCCEVTISKILKKNNIDIKQSFPIEAMQSKIAKDYQLGLSYEKIYKKYGRTFSCVKKILDAYKIKIRPAKFHTIDESFFKEIDTHEKAYFVGLIMADGCVSLNRPKNKINMLSISLQERDGYILQYFIDITKYSGILRRKTYNDINKQDALLLVVQNENFVSELSKYGIFAAKSIIHPFFQNIPKKFMSSAILGYFDGDGSVSYSEKERRLAISFISSLKFAKKLLKLLKKEKMKASMRIRITKGGFKMGEVRMKGNNQAINLYKYMYKSNVKCLTRKKEKFEWVINQIKLGKMKDTSYMNH